MGFIQLHPKDRAKYGAPEQIPFDLGEVGVRQREAFEKKTKRSYNWLLDQLRGVPELDENGNAIPVPVFNADGTPKLNDDGSPAVRMKLTRDPATLAHLAWLALWGFGIRLPWDDKDGEVVFDVIDSGLRVDFSSDEDDEEEDDDEGKAPTDSESTTNPTETSPGQ